MLRLVRLNGSPGHMAGLGWEGLLGVSVPPPPPGGPSQVTPKGEKVTEIPISGGPQCAKIGPWRVPLRSYTVSNIALEWSDGGAQPPVAWGLHLDPPVAGLGADLKCSNWDV